MTPADPAIKMCQYWNQRIQQIQGIWQITEAWIGVNLRILNVACLCPAGVLVSWWFRTQEVDSNNTFEYVIFLLLNSKNSFRENSNDIDVRSLQRVPVHPWLQLHVKAFPSVFMTPKLSWHTELTPHGLGLHGSSPNERIKLKIDSDEDSTSWLVFKCQY